MTYACVRTDNMSGTTLGKDLVSVRFYADAVEAEIENGNVVLVGEYLDGQREVRKATAVATDTPLKDVALIASEEVVKEKSKNTIAEFKNLAGTNARAYRLTSKDVFSLTKEAFTAGSALKVGSVVELAAGTKLSAVESATSATKVGTITAVEGVWYVVEVD